jgi:hypothetical protein
VVAVVPGRFCYFTTTLLLSRDDLRFWMSFSKPLNMVLGRILMILKKFIIQSCAHFTPSHSYVLST